MTLQFTTIDEKSFAYGIDARSAENQVKEGFVRDLVNADIIEGRVKKRKGHVSYAGNVPVRVIGYRQESGNKGCFTLDGSIDLSRIEQTPILVSGRSSLSGPFPPASGLNYYTAWTTNLRKSFAANTTGTITAPATEHGILTSDIFVGLATSTGSNDNDLSGEVIGANDIEIDALTRDITVNYTNGGPAQPVFLYYLDRTTITGQTYTTTQAVTSGTNTITIPSSSHQLANYNMVPELLVGSNSTEWTLVTPDSFTIDILSGTVICTFTVNQSPLPTLAKLILSTAPGNQAVPISLSTGINNNINIPDVGSPLLFGALYEKVGATYSLVFPDSTIYNDTTKDVTLTYTNNSGASSGVYYYNYGSIRANELCVTDVGIGANIGTDSSPQLTLYGLDHTLIYGEEKSVNRRGWVNHIDSYRSPNTTHIVAGLGGNLFAALTKEEMVDRGGIALPFQTSMPTYYARLQARLALETNIGPAFYDTGSAPPRTRGTVSFDNGGTNWAGVTSVQYQPLTAFTRYTLSTPNMVVTGSPISSATGGEDYLTIKDMSHSRHSGVFKIRGIIYNTDTIEIDVENDAITTPDYDDSGCSGLGGVFTDYIDVAGTNEFIAGDSLLSSSWGEDTDIVVVAPLLSTVIISNVYDYFSLASGLLIAGVRTSETIALRDALGTGTTSYLVAGDVISCSAIPYPLVVTSVDATNHTVTFDRPITWYDDITNSITFSVSRRWVAREMPVKDIGDNLINDKITRYFANNDYDSQPFLRSAMVQNNLYLTNGDDEVYKYDGLNTYRAGIIPWQPGLFATAEEKVGDGIPLLPTEAIPLASPYKLGNQLVVTKANSFKFTVGETYKLTDGTKTQYLTLKSDTEDTSGGGGSHYLAFNEVIQLQTLTTSATLTLVYQARYAFRLNLKDQNGVTIASAVTGAEDFVVRLPPITAGSGYIVHIRLVGLPAWDHYDYSNKNIELQVYRTLWTATGEVPVFYQVTTKQVPYVGTDGYIDYDDRLGNDSLVDVDPVVSVLSPETVPAGWDEPARAKYLTSAGNRLVLGNVTDWPTLALTYLTSGTTAYTAYSGQKFLFKKTPTDTQTDTNMVDRVTYELKYTNSAIATSSWSVSAGSSFSFHADVGRVLSAGEWLYLYYSTSSVDGLTYCGWWQISSATLVTGTTYSVTISYTGTTTTPLVLPSVMFATTPYDVPVNVGVDYNMGMTNGDTVNFLAPANRILRRVGMAINATMRMVNKAVHTQTDFIPWLTARSESDTQGQLIIKQPRADIIAPSVTIINTTTVPVYVNGEKTINGSAITAATTRYPSRILVSYNNYPEIFDNPFTVNDDLSASAIDINSSDGQEITGIIPFFGESAFGAALQSGVIVVFKQNSIYLVDLAEKRAGRNPVQRLETQGLGCTAPYSIAPTKDGIAFANDSGIYVLRRNQRIEYLGRFMERKWQNEVDKNYLDLLQGHHYNVGRQYKLSIPLSSESLPGYAENSEVYVYNHTNEGVEEPGGWTRYTNHPATGWANLFQDAFFASVNGVVMRLRAEGVAEDYRDGPDAIEVIFEGRATDFGQAGIRKVVSHVVVNYRTGGTSESTTLEASPDLLSQYDSTTPFRVVNTPPNNGFSTTASQDVTTIRHSLVRRRCIYMTIRITNNGLDESLEVAGMSYVVSGLTSKGITQAASTKK